MEVKMSEILTPNDPNFRIPRNETIISEERRAAIVSAIEKALTAIHKPPFIPETKTDGVTRIENSVALFVDVNQAGEISVHTQNFTIDDMDNGVFSPKDNKSITHTNTMIDLRNILMREIPGARISFFDFDRPYQLPEDKLEFLPYVPLLKIERKPRQDEPNPPKRVSPADQDLRLGRAGLYGTPKADKR